MGKVRQRRDLPWGLDTWTLAFAGRLWEKRFIDYDGNYIYRKKSTSFAQKAPF